MSIRKFRKQMKPFIVVLTVVFILSLAYGGYESFRTSRANKKAQEAMQLNKDYIQKIEIERAKQELSTRFGDKLDKNIVDILAFNQVIDKNLTLHIAKDLKVKVPSSDVDKQYTEIENSVGDKEQFRRMLEVQGLTKDALKAKIEEDLLVQKTLEKFSENINPTDEELNNFVALYGNGATNLSKDEIIKAYKDKKGGEAFNAALAKARKEMQIKDLAPEYANLVEKEEYQEEGFSITNLDLANLEAQISMFQPIPKDGVEKIVKQQITQQIKIAKVAKEKGVEVNQDLALIDQLQEYGIGLMEKVRAEIKPNDEELKAFFNKYKSSYDILPSADAKLVFIKVTPSKADEELAKVAAEEVLKEVTPENFDAKGQELKAQKGYIYEDLGTFSKGQMVKEFENAVKDTASNSITKNVVKTEFGYHVIFVKDNDDKNSKYTVSHILVQPKASEETRKAKLEKLNSLKSNLESGTLAFDKKIDEDVIQIFDVKGITPDGNIPNVAYNPEITKAIFESPVNKVEIIDDLKLDPNQSLILLFEKTNEVKPEAANFEKSKTRVENDYKNFKVAEYLSKLN